MKDLPQGSRRAWRPAPVLTAAPELAVLAAHGGGLGLPRLILAAAAVAVVWAGSLLAHPFGKCWLCRGKRVRVVRGKRRARRCWACKGAGRRQRTGARTVHRIRRTAAAGWRSRRDGDE
jgi:hypothetical protein